MYIASAIYGPDNESFMLGDESISNLTTDQKRHNSWLPSVKGKVHPELCSECGVKKRSGFINEEFKVIKKFDYSSTYDGYTIVSKAFKEFCEKLNLSGLSFYQLKQEKGYFVFDTDNVLKVEQDPEFIKKINLCKTCGVYSTVTLTGIPLAKIDKPLQIGIYKTDLEFASTFERAPIIIVSLDIQNNIPKKFNLDYSEIIPYNEMLKIWKDHKNNDKLKH